MCLGIEGVWLERVGSGVGGDEGMGRVYCMACDGALGGSRVLAEALMIPRYDPIRLFRA